MMMKCALLFVLSFLSVYADTEICSGWDYTNTRDWGTVAKCPSNVVNLCSSGSMQSPVVIQEDHLVNEPSLKQLEFNIDGYTHGSFPLVNRGHTIELGYNPPNAYFTAVPIESSAPHYMHSMEFHVPAENKINIPKNTNTTRRSVEVYFHHQSKDGKAKSVVVMQFDVGKVRNPVLDPIIRALASVPRQGDVVSVGFSGIATQISIVQSRGYDAYYYFQGSMTTPPCEENIHYFLFKHPLLVSEEEYNSFQRMVGSTRRPEQRTLAIGESMLWDPLMSRLPQEPDLSCAPSGNLGGPVDSSYEDACIESHGGSACAWCTTYVNGEEQHTCFARNGAECQDIAGSQTASTYCNVDLRCPASSIAIPFFLILAVLSALLKF